MASLASYFIPVYEDIIPEHVMCYDDEARPDDEVLKSEFGHYLPYSEKGIEDYIKWLDELEPSESGYHKRIKENLLKQL